MWWQENSGFKNHQAIYKLDTLCYTCPKGFGIEKRFCTGIRNEGVSGARSYASGSDRE
jgi:hypothetical protein